MEVKRKITVGEAMLVILFLIMALISTLKIFKGDPHMAILASIVFATLVAKRAGYTWAYIEEGILETIKMAMQSILILMVIGCIIGTWILSGVVPTMIYYGLKMISPGIFLVATCLICAIVSLATGSSWTTAGTVGIALLGVGAGLGIASPIVAGAIISGAYFGDKMSPLSDTTNLAPAMAGSNLFDHIKHMCFTTGPSLLISCVIFGILGFKYAGKELDTALINTFLDTLNTNFNLSPLLLIPPILVIAMVIFRVPALPGLVGGTFLGGLFAYIFQGAGMKEIIYAAHYGYEASTGVKAIDSLLSRGGLDSMMWTVSLILLAMSFGGTLERTGMLHAIVEQMLKVAKSRGSLVVTTFLTCIFCNLTTGDQYMSIVLPGRMFKEAFEEKGLHPKNLSRCLEDFGTITSPFVPWNTCGNFMYTTLMVHPFAYAPYALLNWINPLVSMFYGFTGITMEKLPASKEEKTEEDV
ncbi:Na+/H+ antiporter NhaC [Crassaminicella indica]|uniref:Na+/H+ antiporter NhaC n=1 Tax=Crassaminicella indica TaxID=2855394 RepID=A0ABX8REL4_9CLOT|nr:Na+/H+ antiporter NhaC [Crassaminicella indica]QXM07211.1 Na+/H+ antiporter NhaC [Crassaminicella indica]